MLHSIRNLFAVAVLFCVGAGHADAYSGSSSDDRIVVGCIDHDGTGKKLWGCYSFPYHDEIWSNLGASCTLSANLNIYGGSGDDIISVPRVNGQDLRCRDFLYDWDVITHNGYLITINGDADDDTLYSDFDYTRMYGGSGNDFISHFNSYFINGEGGDDALFSWSGSSLDDLAGSTGIDCLEDGNGVWNTFNCGDQTDDYVAGSGTETDCESPVISCF